jgi:hypothetical protein
LIDQQLYMLQRMLVALGRYLGWATTAQDDLIP